MAEEQRQTQRLIIIPIYNEAVVLERSLELLISFLNNQKKPGLESYKIVVADNGSTDDSAAIAKKFQQKYPDLLEFFYIRQKGRGNALKETLRFFSAKNYLYLDADIPFDPLNIDKMFLTLEAGEADLIAIKRTGRRPFARRLLTLCLRFVNYLLFDLNLSDSQAGIKAFNGKAARLLVNDCLERGYFLDTELLVLANKNGLKVVEEPVEWIEQRYPDRQSKTHIIRDSHGAIRSLTALAGRLNDGFWTNVIGLVLGGIIFAGFFVFFKIKAAPQDFVLVDADQRFFFLELSVWLFGFFILGFYFIAKEAVNLPKRLFIFILLVFFVIASFILVFTLPARSQDIYWNVLLARGFALLGANPYQTAPIDLFHEQLSPLIAWQNLPMTHGPLWVLILSAFVKLIPSIYWLIAALKIFWLALLALALNIFWRIAGLHQLKNKYLIFALLVWNPFIMQEFLLDLHNDIFIMLAVLLSYLFLLNKKYFASGAFLIAGAFVKYVSLFLLPIPIIYLLKSRQTFKEKSAKIASLFLLAAVLYGALYWPFGWSAGNFAGFGFQFSSISSAFNSLPGTLLLSNLFSLSAVKIRIAGLIIALASLLWYVKKNQPHLAYSVPFILVFFWATPWFMPWYLLWILPVAVLWLDPRLLCVISIFALFANYLSATSYAFIIVPVIFGGFIFFGELILNQFKSKKNSSSQSAAPAAGQK